MKGDCKDVMKQGGEKDDGSYYDWNLLGSFGLIKLFADFCESQIEPKKNETNRER